MMDEVWKMGKVKYWRVEMDVKGKVTNTSLLFYIENVKSPYGQLKGYYTFIKKMHSSEYDIYPSLLSL